MIAQQSIKNCSHFKKFDQEVRSNKGLHKNYRAKVTTRLIVQIERYIERPSYNNSSKKDYVFF